jgi:TPR repeat protein
MLLAEMYDRGQGVPQDYVQAHLWLNLAAAHSATAESEVREIAVKYRDRIAAKMTPAQIAEAQKLAREWKPTPTPP